VPELKEILNRIEELRQKLHELGMAKGLADPEVLAASQMLDAVLNEYYRLMKKKMEPPE